VLYSTIRTCTTGNAAEAFEHAKQLMRLQRDLGINHDRPSRTGRSGWRPLIIAANYFYDRLHSS